MTSTPARSQIVWTQIDEAPALATSSFLPIVQAFTAGTGVEVVTSDISLSGRILAAFPDRLTAEQQIDFVVASLAPAGGATRAPFIDFPIRVCLEVIEPPPTLKTPYA